MVKYLQETYQKERWVLIENATPDELVKEFSNVLRVRKVIDTIIFNGSVNHSVKLSKDDRKTLVKTVNEHIVGFINENSQQDTYTLEYYIESGVNKMKITLGLRDFDVSEFKVYGRQV